MAPLGTIGFAPDATGYAAFPVKKPTITCYICGREFGSASYGIHEKACIEKFEIQQARLPKHERRALPARPALLDKVGAAGAASLTKAEIEQLHDASMASFMNEGRVACPNCDRKFAGKDRLEIHLRSCEKDGYFARQKTQAGGKPEAAKQQPASVGKANPPTRISTAVPGPRAGHEGLRGTGRPKSAGLMSANSPSSAHSASTAAHSAPAEMPAKAVPEPAAGNAANATHAVAYAEKFCPTCGVKHAAEAKFCTGCGRQRH